MNVKQNIFFFLPNFIIGGASRSILNICKLIKNSNNTISVISLGKNQYKSYFNKIKVNVIELEQKKTIFAIFKIYSILKKQSVKKKTIFVSNINYANVLSCIFFNNLRNFKLILIERTPLQELRIFFNLKDFFKKNFIYFLIKIFYKKADIIIGNSFGVSSFIKSKLNLPIQTIYPIINYKKVKKKYNNKLQISWIGRDSNEKRILDFLKSLSLIKNKDITINIVCDQNIRIKYKSLIHIKNFRKINFYQYSLVKNFIENIYKKTDIYVSTSVFEGFPNTIVEAVLNKCLVITSDSYGGCRDIIKNNNHGLLFKTKDYEELAKKINFALNNFKDCKKKIDNANKALLRKSKKYNNEYKKLFNSI